MDPSYQFQPVAIKSEPMETMDTQPLMDSTNFLSDHQSPPALEPVVAAVAPSTSTISSNSIPFTISSLPFVPSSPSSNNINSTNSNITISVPSRPMGIGGNFDSAGFALSDLLVQLEDYTPTIPDSVANHFLHMAGFESTDPRISRLISIAAQKYISDILNDAFTHCKLKTVGQIGGKTKSKDKKYVLTMEDLVPVLETAGISIKRPPYFV